MYFMMSQEAPSPDTMRAISDLLKQLYDIYTSEFSEILPNELLQLSHSTSVILKVLMLHYQNPSKFANVQTEFTHDLNRAWGDFNNRILTLREHQTLFKSFKDDKSFYNPAWKENPYFELLRRQYYIIRKYTLRFLYSLDGVEHKTRQQMHFYITNFLNYLSPANYVWQNPEVIKATMESGGANLLNGLKNYLEDIVLNKGQLNIRMTDLKAYKVGVNLAITPGKVIYQNDLIQLIQYAPTTSKVYKTPILITPPWINKYYILDLSPENSMVKWLVAQGYTVFIISWVNGGQELANKEFGDYMHEGPLQALDVVTKVANVDSVHMVGYCIGGTLLACALAYMQAKNDQRAKSATFLMSLLNFSNLGEIGVFVDEPQINALEKVMQKHGYLNGRLLDFAFNTLRPNELIWPYFIHNYLLGKPSKPFDILYWNADSSNLPYKMYIYYLRNMCLENKLRHPGGITLNKEPIDLGKITTPAFFLSSETDHVTLWKSIYSGLHLLNSPIEFVLSESGHVAAVVNPPTKNKYGFKINNKYKTAKSLPKKASEWLLDADKHSGSWWTHWATWLQQHNAEQVAARKISDANILEDAPGTYVLKRI